MGRRLKHIQWALQLLFFFSTSSDVLVCFSFAFVIGLGRSAFSGVDELLLRVEYRWTLSCLHVFSMLKIDRRFLILFSSLYILVLVHLTFSDIGELLLGLGVNSKRLQPFYALFDLVYIIVCHVHVQFFGPQCFLAHCIHLSVSVKVNSTPFNFVFSKLVEKRAYVYIYRLCILE